jgi:hypothetical protein
VRSRGSLYFNRETDTSRCGFYGMRRERSLCVVHVTSSGVLMLSA